MPSVYDPNDPALHAKFRDIPAKWGDPPADMLAKLPKGGDKDKNNWANCRVCGGWHAKNAVHLDYMGHADVTLALIDVDPLWEWEPVEWVDGTPAISVANNEASMWIRMTVLGKTLPAVGTCPANKGDMMKELVGDALRNGALRFGIATKLWSKTDGAAHPQGDDDGPSQSPGGRAGSAAARGTGPRQAPSGPPVDRARETAQRPAGPPSTPSAPTTPPERAREEVALSRDVQVRLAELRHASNKNDAALNVELVRVVRTHANDRAVAGELKIGGLHEMVADDATWAVIREHFLGGAS